MRNAVHRRTYGRKKTVAIRTVSIKNMPNAKRLTRLIVDKSAVLADPEGEGEAVRRLKKTMDDLQQRVRNETRR